MHSRKSHSIPIQDLLGGNVDNAFEAPREIGHFSGDASRQIHHDRSTMRYYVPRSKRNQRVDLNVDYEDKPGYLLESYKMDQLLRWIVYKGFEPVQNESSLIVCLRGTLKKLLYTPYYRKEWIICACRLDDVIYFRSIPTDEKVDIELNASYDERRMSAWGYKFEQYMTAERPYGIPNLSSSNYDQEFCIVATNKIGKHKLLMRTEVDGVNASAYAHCDIGDTSCYVEMKTTKMVPNFQDSFNFKRHKSLKWWAQSIVVGIEENICGFRDDQGIVQSIENFHTDILPAFGQKFWSPQTCFNFCNNFLKYLKSFLVENNHRIVYKFHYNGRENIWVSKLLHSNFQVLPDWFLLEAQKHHINSINIAKAKFSALKNLWSERTPPN